MRQHLGAHDLVLLALREGVAGAVTVNVQIKRTAGEILPDIVLNDGFLIFDGSVVPVFLEVNGNSRVAADGKSLLHDLSPRFMLAYYSHVIKLKMLEIQDFAVIWLPIFRLV